MKIYNNPICTQYTPIKKRKNINFESLYSNKKSLNILQGPTLLNTIADSLTIIKNIRKQKFIHKQFTPNAQGKLPIYDMNPQKRQKIRQKLMNEGGALIGLYCTTCNRNRNSVLAEELNKENTASIPDLIECCKKNSVWNPLRLELQKGLERAKNKQVQNRDFIDTLTKYLKFVQDNEIAQDEKIDSMRRKIVENKTWGEQKFVSVKDGKNYYKF